MIYICKILIIYTRFKTQPKLIFGLPALPEESYKFSLVRAYVCLLLRVFRIGSLVFSDSFMKVGIQNY